MKQGFIALTTVILVFSVTFVIAISVALLGSDILRSNYRTNLSTQAYFYAEACLDEGLNRLRQNWTNDAGTISFDYGSCSFTVTSGATGTVTGTGTVDDITRGIEVTVDSNIDIQTWDEIII